MGEVDVGVLNDDNAHVLGIESQQFERVILGDGVILTVTAGDAVGLVLGGPVVGFTVIVFVGHVFHFIDKAVDEGELVFGFEF